MDKVVKSAGRVLEIFEFFAHRHAPATVSEVAAALEFPLSSTSVLLKSLLTLGYLEYSARSREYQPTIRFAVLGTWIFDRLFSYLYSDDPKIRYSLARWAGAASGFSDLAVRYHDPATA